MLLQNSSENTPAMREVFSQADCLYSHDQVIAAIDVLAKKINAVYYDQNPLILIVMNGGLVFGGQLLSRLNFPLQVDYLQASRYGDNIQGQSLNWRVKPSAELHDRSVLIVDDILDEGKTLLEIIQYCKAQGASDVRSVVLTDKKHDRKAVRDLKADFCGLVLEDRFVFGFGMDYQGYWRNAPGIYAVKGL
jgi:hypoxanthine phosphoribosyltransferase|tara:strand:- start:614 stop:1186 length:573 start_codon:yes stop_codon:yes gene_type:complete